MEIYALEGSYVKHREILQEIAAYVQGEALGQDLYSVEKELFKRLLRLGHAFLSEVIARRGTGKADGPVEVGDEVLPYHLDKERTHLSIFGELQIDRAYYWRPGKSGYYPLDAELNLPSRRYSYLLSEWAQSLVVEEPYEKAVQSVAELLGIPVSKLGQENVAREAGAYFAEFYRQKPIFAAETEGSVIGVQADGKGVRMIGSEKPEKGKEEKARRGKGEKSGGLRRMAVATADYTFNPSPRSPEEMVQVLMKENVEQRRAESRAERKKRRVNGEEEPRRALNVHVAAGMGGKQQAFEELAERVHRRDPEGQKKIVVLLDGEKALEEQLQLSFTGVGLGDRIEALVLDIMHVMDYLWEAGTALYGEKGKERTPWVREHALAILEGRVGRVIGGLRQILSKQELRYSQKKALNKAITYFENHRHMMAYDRYLAAGYPIATGLIEGTCGSLIKDRADRSGSRWSSKGVQAVLNLRAVTKNGDWNEYWTYYMASEHERLYDRSSDAQPSGVDKAA